MGMIQEPCEYTISGHDVLDAISRIGLQKSDTKEVQVVAECLRAIEKLHPVNPQQKIGHWIRDDEHSDLFDITYKCSCCKRSIIVQYGDMDLLYKDYPYCHCGAMMLEREEEIR